MADLQKCNETLSLNRINTEEALNNAQAPGEKDGGDPARNVEINEVYCDHYSGVFLEVIAVIILCAWKLKM